jgi:hypothetical protein
MIGQRRHRPPATAALGERSGLEFRCHQTKHHAVRRHFRPFLRLLLSCRIFPSTCAHRESPIKGVLLNPRPLRHQGRGTQGDTPLFPRRVSRRTAETVPGLDEPLGEKCTGEFLAPALQTGGLFLKSHLESGKSRGSEVCGLCFGSMRTLSARPTGRGVVMSGIRPHRQAHPARSLPFPIFGRCNRDGH